VAEEAIEIVAQKSVKSAMRRRKRGTLERGKGGRGGKVKSRKQAIAIGLSEARSKGAKVPARRKGSTSRGGKSGNSRRATAVETRQTNRSTTQKSRNR
jgi:hypothetical protein